MRLFKATWNEGSQLVWGLDEDMAQRRVRQSGVTGPLSVVPRLHAEQIKLDGRFQQIFYRQVSVMMSAGIGIDRALEMVAKSQSGESAALVEYVGIQIRGGRPLSDSLKAFPASFSAEEIGLIRLGERMGALDRTLVGLADLAERKMELKSRLISSMTYPVCLAMGMFLMGLFFVAFVLPQDRVLLASFGADLPLLSRMLMGLGDYWMLVLCVVVISVLGVVDTFLHRPKLRAQVFSKIPVLGPLVVLLRSAMQLRILSMVVSRGGTVPDAINLMLDTSKDEGVRQQLRMARKAIMQGEELSQAFEGSELFNRLSRDLVAVGFESGKLDVMAVKAAELCEFDADVALETLLSLVEPMLMTIGGVAAALVILAGALPLMSIVAEL